MKFQKMIRIQMMLVGMGAGLLLARPACAQQEMDPELFDVYANTTVTDQASHATPGAEGSVLPHHGIAAAVGEDEIVLGNELGEGIGGVAADAG